MAESRSTWTQLSDLELLSQCEVDTYRASGPGGQKRNKTSSAIRLRHPPSGLIVIAEESRSQPENKARALRRLRRRLFLKLREPFQPGQGSGVPGTLGETSLKIGVKDERFWPAAGLVLDALEAHIGRVGEAAEAIGVSTGSLIGFLTSDETLWQQANEIRKAHGHKLLKATK